VVPGVSSAVSAPALAGIPVTHRGVATAFTVVSGHAETAWQPVLEGVALRGHTIVVLMGLAVRAEIAGFLLGRGFAASTPTALLLAAGTPRSHTWIGPLEALARFEVPEGLEDAPGTIVVGDVVGLSHAQAQRAADEGDGYALTR
jgi:uroporphyrin-III C-methyltransferase/precorrin-2 dehydrogenase/sirohydrochlorin ferrochelatase